VVRMPTLVTQRLRLRPFAPADAADVRRLAGERDIAAGTLTIPHPYDEGVAESWIATHQETYDSGRGLVLAITLREGGGLAGAIGLAIEHAHGRAELGYWVGRPFWGRGYATEAAHALVAHGFGALGLRRVTASVFAHNARSARVLEKLGMRREGLLRRHFWKWGEFVDAVVYGLLAEELAGGGEDAP
jgi:RimJ/RimL family protein N-acetyltransferase